ncbi:MAG: ferrous iron transport protein B [Clostridia bacterium]|nr:ferrous iron transport protein B [Clostridia bacterium]
MEKTSKQYTVLLAGNPNVGKSTVFNALTGMKQHTGNWAGKTVNSAEGYYLYNNIQFRLLDLPGIYSLDAGSPDEKAAVDALYFTKYDCAVIVIDATSIERNLNLVLQILEMTNKTVVCVNLCDEAEKKNIIINSDELSLQLGVPVIKTSARSKKGLNELKEAICNVSERKIKTYDIIRNLDHHAEQAVKIISENMTTNNTVNAKKRWTALHILKSSDKHAEAERLGVTVDKNILQQAEHLLNDTDISDILANYYVDRCEEIYKYCVIINSSACIRDRKIDKILTSKKFGIPVMLLLFGMIFYITIIGANYPSQLLSDLFSYLGVQLNMAAEKAVLDAQIKGLLIDGIYASLSNVVAVMLPPMAIFFPLFTLLEDLGYLPRVAFNLDSVFRKSGTNGKQALTMMMGFGCNACGVTGCRIIDSESERNIATLTNNFSPCNGRFPTLIAVISIFFAGGMPFWLRSGASALILVAVIIFSIFVSLIVTKILAKILKNQNNSFIMELPPYRVPQIGKTIIRSLFDRTIFVLGRAVMVAAPAGAMIWLLTNIDMNGNSVVSYLISFLEPLGTVMGLDGTILTGFLLGFPANEIVLPITLMLYLNNGTMTDYSSLSELQNILVSNGWTIRTAVCMLIFTLMHFPCSTTCITVKKETGSIRWAVLSFIIPTVCGIICCIFANIAFSLFGIT